MKSATELIGKFGWTRDKLRRELSAVVRELQRQYPSIQHTLYDDDSARVLLLGDPVLRAAIGYTYPDFMGPYFADFKIKPPNTSDRYTSDRYGLSQQFAFGKANASTPSEVRQMADEFGKLICGGEMSCGLPIPSVTRHYDHQGAYTHSLVTVFSTWDTPGKARELIVINVSEYMKHGSKNLVPRR